MRYVLWVGGILFGLLITTALAAIVYLRIGPVGPVPATDPFILLNQKHANLTQNAAIVYQQAFDMFVEPPVTDWFRGCVSWEQDRERVEQWLAENQAYYDLIRSASRTKDCWFVISLDPDGFFEMPYLGHFRNAQKLCMVRAELAATKYELEAFEEALDVMDRVARHMGEQPFVVSYLVGVAGSALLQSLVLCPLDWPGLAEGERRAYLRRSERWFVPLPSLTSAIQTERDSLCWNPFFRGNAPRFLITPRRFAGEVDRHFAPLLKWVAQAPVQQAAPDNIHRAAISAVQATPFALTDPVRGLASQFMPSLNRVVDLQIRLVVSQRGNDLVRNIHLYAFENASLPANLDVFDPDITIDPYTAKPFIYWRTETGFTLYSAGLDRDDDRARHHHKFGETGDAPNGDYVFWPLQDP